MAFGHAAELLSIFYSRHSSTLTAETAVHSHKSVRLKQALIKLPTPQTSVGNGNRAFAPNRIVQKPRPENYFYTPSRIWPRLGQGLYTLKGPGTVRLRTAGNTTPHTGPRYHAELFKMSSKRKANSESSA